MKTKILKENERSINVLIDSLKSNKIVVFKTDTIYGISCNALNSTACERIFQIKKRENKPMNILLGDNCNLSDYVEVPCMAKQIINQFWNGPLTIIFNKKYNFSYTVNCGLNTIGIRKPKDALCKKILNSIDFPIVSTSVNISGLPAINDPKEIFDTFNGQIDFILDSGKVSNASPSTIISVENDSLKLIRDGAIPFFEILKLK